MKDGIGRFAVSLAGHDKGKIYVAVGYQDGRYLLADGRHRTLESPKKKKEKHIRFLLWDPVPFPSGIPVRNEEVKRAIRLATAGSPSFRR